jgi:hypothetical protein
MYRKLLLATLLLFLSQALAAEARACSCVEHGTPVCAAYWRADAVFTGVVTDIKKVPDAEQTSPPIALLHFIVEDKFRNVTASELEVETLHGTSCDMTFEKGKRWLVYAYRNASTGRLVISPCTRTHQISGTDDDLSYIRGLSQRPPEQSVHGRLAYFKYDPLADIKVVVSGAGRSFETKTDAEGNFSVQLPQGGAYTVRAVVPYSAGAYSHTAAVETDPTDEQTVLEYPVELPTGRCTYSELDVFKVDLHATAEISGKVIDETGQPVTRGYVHLIDAVQKEGSQSWGEHARIGEDGSFKFEGVAVGSFLLVINPRDEAPGESDAPHPRTFYPSVADREQASPLVITEGLKVEDIAFRVRGPLKKRVVSGRVLWPDGKPAEAYVSLYNGDKYVRLVRSGADGRFTMDIYGDFDYKLEVKAFGPKAGQSEKVKIPSALKPAPMLLKLKPSKP